MYPTIRVLLNKSIMIKVYHHIKKLYHPSIIVKEYKYIIVSLLKSFAVLEYWLTNLFKEIFEVISSNN